jgi:N-acetylglucosamine malate deacetylase 1
MMERVMVIATHPDDETLGCGGTILKLKKMRKKLFWLIMSHISEENGFSAKRVDMRRREIEAVTKFYAFDGVTELRLPTTQLDTIPVRRIVDSLNSVIQNVKPDTLFVPNQNDVHSDHRITFSCLMSCIKTFRAPFVKRIFMYEVISETEYAPALASHAFLPNSFSDITKFIERKIKVMKIYRSEIGRHPFPRSKETIKALATFRGGISGCKYAEAFQMLRDAW